jgi:hypothetical protein
MRVRLWVSSCLLAVACGDIEVRSVRVAETVPAALEGEWAGSWQSTLTSTGGALTVRVQEFASQPVVSLQITNPCLVPRTYQLALEGGAIELRADGAVVFAARLDQDQRLVGTFQCDADRGTWSASRQRGLPELVDLSGEWSGLLSPPGITPVAVALTLSQTVAAGALTLAGSLRVPDFLLATIPVEGVVMFRDTGFDLTLRSGAGVVPPLVLSGLGELDPVRVELGLVQFLGPSPLPFQQAVFRAQRDD